MAAADDDLFKPLSAKTGRKQWASGGREMDGGRARMGDANRIRMAFLRRQRDAEGKAPKSAESLIDADNRKGSKG